MDMLPLFNYPVSVAWLDDDAVFLKTASDIIGKEIEIQTFLSPIIFQNYIKNYIPYIETVKFVFGRTENEEYETSNHLPIDININSFLQLPNHVERKNEISVLIVDYFMPELTGIELCRILKNKPFKKILLTGEADTTQAVNAFNEGIIDCFIRKNSMTLLSDIRKHIEILTNEYFIDRTRSLLSHFEIEQKIALSDPVFINFFRKWCQQNDIREHYIFDKQGSMQIINSNGEKSFFVIHSDRTLDQFCKSYNDIDNVKNAIREVNGRKKIPFFGLGLEGWQYEDIDLSSHFYLPKILEGREKYYWIVKREEIK